MATLKLVISSVFFALLIIRITPQKLPRQPDDLISSLRLELELLKSKVSFLEYGIVLSNRELQSKDDAITKMDKIIFEKDESIASLQHMFDSFQQKESVDVKGQTEPHSYTAELEKQVERLKTEIEKYDRRKVELEVQANVAEKKIQEISLNLENLQKFNSEQKTIIHKTEQALQVAEEEKMKAELEATIMASVESFIVSWNNHWKPALNSSFQKILVIVSKLQRDAKGYFESVKTKGIPVLKDRWLSFVAYLKPHLESLTAKTFEAYEASMDSLLSHIVMVQKAAAPFILEAHKFAHLCINQIETVTKPYLDGLVTLEPYSRKLVCVYKAFSRSVILYHKQVQQMLKTNEVTRTLATMEVAWFVATAIMCLPVVFLSKLYLAVFRKKARKSRRVSHTNHIRRRTKRTLFE